LYNRKKIYFFELFKLADERGAAKPQMLLAVFASASIEEVNHKPDGREMSLVCVVIN
jgi:hypothetical protein